MFLRRHVLVQDHVDDLSAFDDNVPVGDLGGEAEVLFHQNNGQSRFFHFTDHGADLLQERVSAIMTTSVKTCSPDANVKDESVSRLSDLSLCIDNCRRLVEPIARRREIALLIPESMDLPSLWADQVLIKQILTNVLGNAVKYVQDGGEVRLDVADADDGGLRVTISDNGPGISRDKLDRLLETGNRDPFLSKQGSGGIGLYLSCRAMESIGGQLLIDSEVGEGTSISLMLPPHVVERRAGT